MLFSVESIFSTSSMIIINASLKILIFLLGILVGEFLQIDLDDGNMIKIF
jgi:hypothetical protein